MSKAAEDIDSLPLPPSSSLEYSPLERTLRRLERLTHLLRMMSLMSFLCTIACVVVSLNTIFSLPRVKTDLYGSSYYVGTVPLYRSSFYLSLVVAAMALLSVMVYESLRKQGESLFEEISDELEWHVREPHAAPRGASEGRPELHARIVLRSFARTTDLPLVPGKFGPALYAALNILIVFAEMLFIKVFV